MTPAMPFPRSEPLQASKILRQAAHAEARLGLACVVLLEVCERPGARDRSGEQGAAPAQAHPQRCSQVGEYEVDAQGIAAWTQMLKFGCIGLP